MGMFCVGMELFFCSGIYTAFPVPYPLIWDKNGRAKSRISPGKSGCFPVFPWELTMEWQYRNNAFERNTEIHDSKPPDRLEKTGISHLLSRARFLTWRSFDVRNGNIWNAREKPWNHMETNISYNASSQTTAQVLPPSARLGSIVSLWDT